ncbi:uncharacterized protein TRIVIDRAFT_228332 [Trichoderma virens Gv29-8]|uniref:Uncharacterized protein n=1 Tax=Hypocrea virens (strain Gv29-8 / FGSC 10586) TaxID=413071 RepID=G9NC70_HYPVG|nr:uncharacterized protein TRIVIDRAFT_228332 [Trichoderma virens Gv29-8]EHK15295.1 hypothetical protein TRIVIDRAFT_228332 [Trichoderma virens Gv29-8]UKZ51241.1 hypothetical protein TrVGV298_004999 [Trichoderma virens]
MASNRFDSISHQDPSSASLIREHTSQSEDNSFLKTTETKSELENARPTHRSKKTAATIYTSFVRWWPELLSCTFAIAVFLVLALVLRPYQGKILSSWPLAITINTFVAICMLLIKASLAMIVSNGIGQLKWVWYSKPRPLEDLQQYDSASRGVVGSLGLMWTHRNGRRMIPLLGAILTIILTLVDPFGQALVQLENCTVVDPSIRSTIATTHHANLLNTDRIYILNGGAMGPMMIGMLNESLIPPVTFDCPTGNCTYPDPYRSGGFCSKCSDVSDQVVATNESTWYWEEANFTLSVNTGSQYVSGQSGVLQMAAQRTTSADTIASVQVMGSQLTQCKDNSTTPWRCRTYGAAVCEINPCVVSYTGKVETGNLKETVVATSEVWSSGVETYNNYMGSIDVSCLNTSERNALQHAGFHLKPDTSWLAYNVSFYRQNSSYIVVNGSDVRPECIYIMDRQQISAMNSLFFNDGFINTIVSTMSSPTGLFIFGEIQWQAIWNGGVMDFVDIQRAFDGLTKGLTTYARSNPRDSIEGGLGDSFRNGTSYRNTTCIQLQWQWISYLATALIGTILFLIGTMIMTRTSLEVNGQDYKISILPLMFHGVAFRDPEASFKNPGFIDDMTAEAEKLYVQFEPAERGWQFVEKKIT